MRVVGAVVLVIAIAGCGATQSTRLAVSSDGRAVVQDAYDNQRLDRDWSCGSLRTAVNRLAVDLDYSTVLQIINEATGRTCDEALTQVHRGLTAGSVRTLLGKPDRISRCCLLYNWTPAATSSTDGARIFLTRNQVTRIQISVHL